MNRVLRTYLEVRWRKDNHPKYWRYFDEWVNNITDIQLMYFEKDMKKELQLLN